MKQRLYILTIFLFSAIVLVHAQESCNSYDGQTFKAGDVLRLGQHYISSSGYTCIKEGFTNEYGRKQYQDLKNDGLAFSTVTVKGIIPENADIFYSKEPLLLVQSEKVSNKELYIHINKAIERGEVISSMPEKPLIENSVELTPELMFSCCVRVNKLPVDDNVILNYIATLDKTMGQECQSDKFKFEKIKVEYKSKLEKNIAEFDFSKTYFIQVDNSRDEYDFIKKGYPLSYNSLENGTVKNFIPSNGFNFLVDNIGFARFLPLDADKAEKYELRNKGAEKRSYTSPNVHTIVYLTLLDKRMEIPKDKYSMVNVEKVYRHTIIGANVKGLEVYDHPSFKYNLIGSNLTK